MKRIVSLLLSVVLLVGCVFTLVSCGNAYPKLKKAFEKEGFTENEQFTAVADSIKAELEKDEYAVDIHMLTKTVTSVLIIEFKSTKELVEAYKESDTMKGLVKDIKDNEDVKEMYKSLEDAGYVKENCICVPLSILYVKDITEIVKKA